jgi:Aminoglycoside 3-N-acetyltransferase
MTFLHYVEDLFKDTLPVKLYNDNPLESIVIDVNGNKTVVKNYVFSDEARRYRDNRNLRHALMQDKAIRAEKIGNTKLILLNTDQVVECAQEMIKSGKPLWNV